jgi:hypothetical protein
MDKPPTTITVKRQEGQVLVTFTPGLTIDQWGALTLSRPMSRTEFEEAAQSLASQWGLQVAYGTPGHSETDDPAP